jgi:hypothetical protein
MIARLIEPSWPSPSRAPGIPGIEPDNILFIVGWHLLCFRRGYGLVARYCANATSRARYTFRIMIRVKARGTSCSFRCKAS